MAKSTKKPKEKVANRAQYSRISYLYQAGEYLASMSSEEKSNGPPGCLSAQRNSSAHQDRTCQPTASQDASATAQEQGKPGPSATANLEPLSRRLMAEMRRVALKTQIRLDPSIKRRVCKFCDSRVSPETGAGKAYIENRSRRGNKPWADVLVVECGTCGGRKRYPVGAERQQKREHRGPGHHNDEGE